MELKPVFFVVKESGGLTPIPFWQGPGTAVEKPCSPDDPPGPHPRPVTWKTCLLFDPDSVVPHEDFELRDATATEIERAVPNPTLSCESYKYAPISAIYNLKMTESEAEAFNQGC